MSGYIPLYVMHVYALLISHRCTKKVTLSVRATKLSNLSRHVEGSGTNMHSKLNKNGFNHAVLLRKITV